MDDEARDPDRYDIIIRHREVIYHGVLGTSTPIEVGAGMAFARYLSHVGITAHNYPLFLSIIETNNRWVVDELIGNREPRLLFSGVKPSYHLVRRVMELLSAWHPGQIYAKVLLAVLGVIEYAFYQPDDGYKIYQLEITDLHNLGKFLHEGEDQTSPVNALILEILDHITRLGDYEPSLSKSVIARHAFNIRDSYFDNTKRLVDTIPSVLLVRLDPAEREVAPSREYADLARKID